MTEQGLVRLWHDEEGWGVIDSASTPGGCWAHFSAILAVGFRSLEVGESVSFTAEVAEQDGYAYRALEVWSTDRGPVRGAPAEDLPDGGVRGAYGSTLTLELDDDLTDAPRKTVQE